MRAIRLKVYAAGRKDSARPRESASNSVRHESTKGELNIRVTRIPKADVLEIDADASTNDAASCERSDAAEGVRCRQKRRGKAQRTNIHQRKK